MWQLDAVQIWRGLSYCACLSLCVSLLKRCGQVDIDTAPYCFNDVRRRGILVCKTRTCEFIFFESPFRVKLLKSISSKYYTSLGGHVPNDTARKGIGLARGRHSVLP